MAKQSVNAGLRFSNRLLSWLKETSVDQPSTPPCITASGRLKAKSFMLLFSPNKAEQNNSIDQGSVTGSTGED